MEDNRVILLALLILIISSFNLSSITGQATDTRTGKGIYGGIYTSTFAWYPEGMGDIDGNYLFNKNDCAVIARNLQESQGRFGLISLYFDPLADFDPVPTSYTGGYGDGRIDDRDVSKCYAWATRMNSVDEGNSLRLPMERKCTEGEVSPSFYGYRVCINGVVEEKRCPDGYRATTDRYGNVLCALQSLQAENYEDLGIMAP